MALMAKYWGFVLWRCWVTFGLTQALRCVKDSLFSGDIE